MLHLGGANSPAQAQEQYFKAGKTESVFQWLYCKVLIWI